MSAEKASRLMLSAATKMQHELIEARKRIAELEGFVKWVREEGSDYWRDEASKLLEKGKE